MRCQIFALFIIVIGMLLIPGVLAGDNKVPRDGTVYVGEADLDLSDCAIRNGDEIAWWESGNPQGTPTARARVADVRKFTVDPETFNGHTGMWYGLIGKKAAFKVEEPFLQVDLNENGIDTEPDSIKRGNLVSFKVSTNLAGLSQRAGSSGALVTINLTGPNETEYHTLSSSQTSDFNLDKVYVYASPYDTGVVWDTADAKKFPDGDYTLSAVTNVNRINEINPESGATFTEKKTYRLGKTEVKPTEVTTEKSDKKTKDNEQNLTAESKKEDTSNTTVSATKSSKKKKTEAELLQEQNLSKGKMTEEVTAEPTHSSKTSKKDMVTSDSQKNQTTEETSEPTPEITEIQTIDTTPEPTPEVTDEPIPDVTPQATRKPLPHPPGPGPSPTKKATPIQIGVILSALTTGALLVVFKRKNE